MEHLPSIIWHWKDVCWARYFPGCPTNLAWLKHGISLSGRFVSAVYSAVLRPFLCYDRILVSSSDQEHWILRRYISILARSTTCLFGSFSELPSPSISTPSTETLCLWSSRLSYGRMIANGRTYTLFYLKFNSAHHFIIYWSIDFLVLIIFIGTEHENFQGLVSLAFWFPL